MSLHCAHAQAVRAGQLLSSKVGVSCQGFTDEAIPSQVLPKCEHLFGKPLNFFFCSNVAGQWNPVFMQPLPEEEIVIRDDQDPRVSMLTVLVRTTCITFYPQII